MAWMGSMEGSCTGGTKRLGTFDKPPIIIVEWDDLTYTWFYRPHPTRHLAESLVGAGVPVVIVQRPQHGGKRAIFGNWNRSSLGFGVVLRGIRSLRSCTTNFRA